MVPSKYPKHLGLGLEIVSQIRVMSGEDYIFIAEQNKGLSNKY